MAFFINFFGLLASLGVLIWGADRFIDNSSSIAKRFGVNELTIGLTVVALGTSAPEIFVGISSVINQSENIAIGAVVGSNISNIGLIFGVSCIGITLIPKKTPLIQFSPLILSALVLGFTLYDLVISVFDSVLLLFVFLYFLFVIFRKDSSSNLDSFNETEQKKINTTFFYLIAGLISLIVGSQYAVVCAENIAKLLNISELIIGLTIIAIGTSLPELAATISAILKKKTNMIVGNVIGSNVLNIVLVVPIIGIFSNVLLEENLFVRDYYSMIFATIAFICAVIIFASKLINLFTIRLAGIFLVLSYFIYILNLSALI